MAMASADETGGSLMHESTRIATSRSTASNGFRCISPMPWNLVKTWVSLKQSSCREVSVATVQFGLLSINPRNETVRPNCCSSKAISEARNPPRENPNSRMSPIGWCSLIRSAYSNAILLRLENSEVAPHCNRD